MLNFLYIIIIGFLAGVLAKFVMPGKDPGGFIITTVLGVVGALLATFLGRLIGWYKEGESGGFIAAVVGAIIILFVYRIIKRRTA
jgi:uncharacterized membrane protein YeaQ/YmgE (transglycosylase-associated protein family)